MLPQLQLMGLKLRWQQTMRTETEEENDAWMPMVEQAMRKHKTAMFEEMKMNLVHSSLDKQPPEEKAYSNILSMLESI